MSDEDFPAAHSMDTEWYAVDSEGNVGRFETGEAGAAPNSAMAYRDEAPTVADILRALPPDSGVEYDIDDLVAIPGGPVFNFGWGTQRFETASFSDARSCYSILMWLADERLIGVRRVGTTQTGSGVWVRLMSLGRQTDSVTVERIPNSKYALGYTEDPVPVGTLQQWIQDGLVLKAWVNHRLSSSRIGIYQYEHGFGIAGPYLRDSVPRRPLKLDQIPEGLRQIIESTRFERRSFERDAAIDPREAGECSSWDSAWVGLDGVVHRDDEDGDGGIR